MVIDALICIEWLRQSIALLRPCRAGRLASIVRLVGLAGLLTVLASCAVKRSSYDVPSYALPEQFKNRQVAEVAPVSAESVDVAPAAEMPVKTTDFRINEWWRLFGSPELSALIDRGMANNPDIRIAALHIAQAKTRVEQARGGQFPSLDAAFSGGPQKGNSPSAAVSGLTLNGSWQIDVWGEKAAMVEEANFQLWQSVYDANNARRTVAAAMAASYLDYLLCNERLKISRETEKILIGLLATMEKRAALGDATLLELEQQRSAIYSELALIPNLELQREDAIESLAYLSGTVPGAMKLSDADLDSLHLPDAIPDLPSSLLLRRPDVRSVEARLLAADVDIDVMRARVLPTIGLTSQVGYSGLMSQLLKPESFFWNTFASVAGNVFDDGKLSANVRQSSLQHEEMVETYSRTILQAVREVERALYSVRVSGQRAKLENEALSFSQNAWDISNKIYGVGGVDFMALQETQRTYRRHLEDYQQIRSDYFHAYVGLFLALGGGEDSDDALPGKGKRPKSVAVPAASPAQEASAEPVQGVLWKAGPDDESGNAEYWQVTLPGHYQRKTVDAVLRDLQVRFPVQMEKKNLYPTLEGRLDDSKDGQTAWYRLNVARFHTATAATDFCQLLRADMQRCQVKSSRSSEPLPEAPMPESKAVQMNSGLVPLMSLPKTDSVVEPDIAIAQAVPAIPEPLPAQPQPDVLVSPVSIPAPVASKAPEPVAAVEPLPSAAAVPVPETPAPALANTAAITTVAEVIPAAAVPEEDTSVPLFWKVELAEHYQRRKVAGVLHELQSRFPVQMKGKNLYLSKDQYVVHGALYRLQVAQFDTARAAWDFCQSMRASSGAEPSGCQVVSSRSEIPLKEEAINDQK